MQRQINGIVRGVVVAGHPLLEQKWGCRGGEGMKNYEKEPGQEEGEETLGYPLHEEEGQHQQQ